MILDHCYRKSVTYSQDQIFSVDKWFRNKTNKNNNKPKTNKNNNNPKSNNNNKNNKRTSLLADVRKSIGLEIPHNSWVQVGSRLSDLREALVVPPVVGTL